MSNLLLLKVIYKQLGLGPWLPITLPQGWQPYHAAKALSIQGLQRLSSRLVLTLAPLKLQSFLDPCTTSSLPFI